MKHLILTTMLLFTALLTPLPVFASGSDPVSPVPYQAPDAGTLLEGVNPSETFSQTGMREQSFILQRREFLRHPEIAPASIFRWSFPTTP